MSKHKPIYKLAITPKCIASFPSVSKPDTESQFADGKYKCSFLIDKDDAALKEMKKTVINLARQAWGADVDLTSLTLPFKDGDKREREEFKGKVYLTAKSSRKPVAVGPDAQPLDDSQGIYGGNIVKGAINFGPYEMAGRKGVTAYLNQIQLIGEGESFGSSKDQIVFEAVESSEASGTLDDVADMFNDVDDENIPF